MFTLEASPLDWAKSQRALGSTLVSLGKREAGTANIEAGLASVQSALEGYSSEHSAHLWAETQNQLGNILISLAERDAGTGNLDAAVNACRAALLVYTRERTPRDWAATRENLGIALRVLGQRSVGTIQLEESIDAFRLALAVYTRELAPLDWARNQSHLANALQILGERTGEIDLLNSAVTACKTALDECARDRTPSEWAQIQVSLGMALQAIGERETGTQNIESAVAAFRAALEVLTPETAPRQWAATTGNLGNALRVLGQREIGSTNLEASIEALSAALDIHNRESALPDWADVCSNLGNTFLDLAVRESNKGELKAAVEAAALRLHSLDPTSPDLANAEKSLEVALRKYAARGTGISRLDGAIQAFKAALSVFTKEAAPGRWAGLQVNLANALRVRGEHETETTYLEESVDSSRAALEVFTHTNSPREWAKAQINLGAALAGLDARGVFTASAAAINAYQAALAVSTSENGPVEWAAAQNNLASMLNRVATKTLDPADWQKAAEAWQELLESALVTVITASGTRELERSLSGIWQIGSACALAWLRAGDASSSFKTAQKARSIQARAIVWADLEDADETLAKELRQLRAAWRSAAAAADAAAERWQNAGNRRDDWQNYEAKLAIVHQTFQSYRAALKEPAELDLAAIAAVVPVGGALVTLIAGDDYGGALMLRSNSTPHGEPEILALALPELTHQSVYQLLDPGSLDEMLAGHEHRGIGWFGGFSSFRNALAELDRACLPEAWLNWNIVIEATLDSLGALGLGEVQRWFKREGISPDSEIVLSPSGIMSMLPLGAARDPETGRCLLDDYAIRTIPSADLLLGCAASAGGIKQEDYSLSAVTDPREDLLSEEDRQSPALEAFAGLPVHALNGRESTPSRVTENLSTATHFVYYGHGGFDSGTGRSALLLAQDSAYPNRPDEINDTQLRHLRLSNLRLAVLAACETGLIDFHQPPDEFIGLIESLLQAGCAMVVASLWPVAAGFTRNLTGQMLLRHVRGNESGEREGPAQALRRAQLALRHEARPIYGLRAQSALPGSVAAATAHTPILTSDQPIFWAAFTCAGA